VVLPSHPTNTSLLELHLLGIPGLEHLHSWISIPFFILYLITLLANTTLLYLIKAEPDLHHPMFFFLAMLALVDLLMSTSITPKMLSIFWFNSTSISLQACVAQMFLLHSCTALESGLLVAMALDRYVAICNPLRYPSILTSTRVVAMGLATLLRAVFFMAPVTLQVLHLPFCSPSAQLGHSYCEHLAVLSLACGDVTFSSTYSLSISTYVVTFDSFLILLSYLLILRAVLGLSSSPAAQHKAFSTCTSHLFLMLLFYIPGLLSISMDQELPPHTQVLLANVYVLIPPAFNPLIYGIRTKQIRD
ncbi:O52M1 protein, partial [Turnix velox]|nr:O52M1 protein [Turnix velox]